MTHHRRHYLLLLLLLAGCTGSGGDSIEDVYRDSSTSLSLPSSTSSAPSATTVLAGRLDELQVAGSWAVATSSPRAVFAAGDKVTFVGDGTMIVATELGHMWVGSWRVRTWATGRIGEDGMSSPLPPELNLLARGVQFNYSVEASPRELRLSKAPDDALVLTRA